MLSRPLHLCEVLEEEHRALYAGSDRPGWHYDAAQLPTQRDALEKEWRRMLGEAAPADATAFNKLVDGKLLTTVTPYRRLLPCASPATRKLLDSADVKKLTAEETQYLNRQLLDDAFGNYVQRADDARLKAVYAKIHQHDTTALCISGGGIRSATFALGVLQGLAKRNLLDKFDYVSTVSGGGYIGSWLSSWMRRHPQGPAGVAEELGAGPRATLEPEPKPIDHLRDYSNYLTPRVGAFSGDTLAAAALYVRNLLLNWLILVPLLVALVALPRLIYAIYFHSFSGELVPALLRAGLWLTKNHLPGAGLANALADRLYAGISTSVSLTVATFALALAGYYLGMNRPVDNRFGNASPEKTQAKFVGLCLVPLLIASIALTTGWARARMQQQPFTGSTAIVFLIPLAVGVVFAARYMFHTAGERRQSLLASFRGTADWKVPRETLGVLVAGGVSLLFAYFLTHVVFPDPYVPLTQNTFPAPFLDLHVVKPVSALYVCFAVPLMLAVLFISATIFIAVAHTVNEDYDREWWARCSGYVLGVMVAWIAVTGIAIFGPVAIFFAPKMIAAAGGITGLVSVLLGRSSKTGAQQESAKSSPAALAATFAAPLFIAFLLAALSLLTTKALQVASMSDAEADVKAAQVWSSEHVDGEVKVAVKDRPMLDPARLAGWEHLHTIDTAGYLETSGLVVALLVVAALAALVVNVNKFSMHSLYRNRLIRAYLGASRTARDPNPFTGFDPQDNLAMHQLRPELLWPTSFVDVDAFVAKLKDRKASGVVANLRDAIKQVYPSVLEDDFLRRKVQQVAKPSYWLGRKLYDFIERVKPSLLADGKQPEYAAELFQVINHILERYDLTQPPQARSISERLKSVFTGASESDARRDPARLRTNREALDAAFSKELRPMSAARPMHVVNMALNLVSGEKLAWQQRKAESFTVSPMHSGSLQLGYRDSSEYGGRAGISLGTAITISGAAVSPNMGYHSSAPLAFLLTLFNVRLGWWLGNPGAHGAKSWKNDGPSLALQPLLGEATGATNDRFGYVYLSDGGHFENLGLYEMVLRRRRFIVVSDAGADPTHNFEDLGNAIRKIRIDLGVPIKMSEPMLIYRRADKAEEVKAGRYCAFGTIEYKAVDGDGTPDGQILYIKPTVYMTEPKDIYNYATSSAEFPHESTADQWFSEAQFESYRMLGRHTVDQICEEDGWKPASMKEFFERAEAYAGGKKKIRVVNADATKREVVIENTSRIAVKSSEWVMAGSDGTNHYFRASMAAGEKQRISLPRRVPMQKGTRLRLFDQNGEFLTDFEI